MVDQDEGDDRQDFAETITLDPVSDRVRSVAFLLRELRSVPPESDLMKEGIALIQAVREGITPRERPSEPETRH